VSNITAIRKRKSNFNLCRVVCMMCERTIIPEHVRDFSVKRLCKLLLELIKALATETLMNEKANKANIECLRVTYVT